MDTFKKILFHAGYSLWAGFLFAGPPLILYTLIKWDPVYSRDGESLGVVVSVVSYWAAAILYMKSKDKLRKRAYDLGVLLGKEFSEEEKKKVRDEYFEWEFSEYKKLLKESPELASANEHRKRIADAQKYTK